MKPQIADAYESGDMPPKMVLELPAGDSESS
jgi:hypothetical protein